eukprot:TRINITY_DN25103_c0_g1_i4.p2 TRINITY_DN25103_c0_g1~~TRINITY_DN25103_c0_g1_i4.p2  ORF type:complete len:109 (+),score=8.69 TRINITY_DN25103_c0_g1_i4:125-451(+)
MQNTGLVLVAGQLPSRQTMNPHAELQGIRIRHGSRTRGSVRARQGCQGKQLGGLILLTTNSAGDRSVAAALDTTSDRHHTAAHVGERPPVSPAVLTRAGNLREKGRKR